MCLAAGGEIALHTLAEHGFADLWECVADAGDKSTAAQHARGKPHGLCTKSNVKCVAFQRAHVIGHRHNVESGILNAVYTDFLLQPADRFQIHGIPLEGNVVVNIYRHTPIYGLYDFPVILADLIRIVLEIERPNRCDRRSTDFCGMFCQPRSGIAVRRADVRHNRHSARRRFDRLFRDGAAFFLGHHDTGAIRAVDEQAVHLAAEIVDQRVQPFKVHLPGLAERRDHRRNYTIHLKHFSSPFQSLM